MKLAFVILMQATCLGISVGIPTGQGREDELEDNLTGDLDMNMGTFTRLKDIIEENRDTIIDHIDEKIDELKRDIILNDNNDFFIDIGEELRQIENEDPSSICSPRGEEPPVCGEFGECVPEEGGEAYTCRCEHGYTGENCQLIDHCKDVECKQGSECINKRDGFQCDCQHGTYGELCEFSEKVEI